MLGLTNGCSLLHPHAWPHAIVWLHNDGFAAVRPDEIAAQRPNRRKRLSHAVACKNCPYSCRHWLLNVVAGHPPLPILVEHGRNRFDRRLFMLEAAVVLDYDVLAVRHPGKRLRICRALEFSRENLA